MKFLYFFMYSFRNGNKKKQGPGIVFFVRFFSMMQKSLYTIATIHIFTFILTIKKYSRFFSKADTLNIGAN